MPVTSRPRRTCSVMPLHAASVVLPSKHSPGPSPYIGWKWSKPQMPSKPSPSASCARDASSGQGIRCWAMSSPKRMDALYYRTTETRHRCEPRRRCGRRLRVEADLALVECRGGREDPDRNLEHQDAERLGIVHAHGRRRAGGQQAAGAARDHPLERAEHDQVTGHGHEGCKVGEDILDRGEPVGRELAPAPEELLEHIGSE